MKTTTSLAMLLLLNLALAGCTTTGTGGGQLAGGGAAEEPVAFSWTSTDGRVVQAVFPGQLWRGSRLITSVFFVESPQTLRTIEFLRNWKVMKPGLLLFF